MTSHDLLAAILAAPNDDLPRLIAADWLDENGEPERAEFIRYQIMKPQKPKGGGWGCECSSPDARPPCSKCEKLTDEELAESDDKDSELRNWNRVWGNACAKCVNFESKSLVDVEGVKVEIIERRGFPDEIRCTLADWVGRVCPKSPLNPDLLRGAKCLPGCETCHGTGRLPGIAGWVCGQWPVTKVVLTDCEPMIGSNSAMDNYVWWRLVSDRHGPVVIDSQLWECLRGARIFGGGRPTVLKWYMGRENALTALSDAAIRYGRRLAGLGELNFITPPTSLLH